MTTFKDRLQSDLRTAMKARDELTTSTLRMALAAIAIEQTTGAAHSLTDEEVLAVLKREARKRKEAATAFAGAGRAEQAARESAEEEILTSYLPAQLSDEELAKLVAEALTGLEVTGKSAMGAAMKLANAEVAGRADGGRVAAEVRRQLGI